MDTNDFEKYPGVDIEKKVERSIPEGQNFEESFKDGVPEFAGENLSVETQYGQANPENLYYGEAKDSNTEEESGEEHDDGIANAAALINYGLDAAARNLGVETVVQKIKGFDASGREDPIGDLFKELDIDTPEATQVIGDASSAAAANETAFRKGVNNPGRSKSHEGAFKALADMKELISEVEGADPRYKELRDKARSAGKGYFEYAVSEFGTRGLTELFSVLAEQREKADQKESEVDLVEDEKPEINKIDRPMLGEDKPNGSLNPGIFKKQI